MAVTTWTQVAGMSSDTEVDNVEDFIEQAEASKDAAAASAAAAALSEAAAETAETNAETAETNAAASETNASTSETNAATSASAAATSATSAGNSETAAAASETAAAASETAAAASEAAAATSETNAANSATAAQTAETNAETAETNAETAKVAAETSETNAAASAATATTKASEASASAATATTKASEASTSASSASASATAAQTAQTAAETAQTAAETAQAAAETAETNAETAETGAQAAQTAAEAAKDAIDGLYLGAQSSDPSVDGLGAALTAGDWYYNTTSNIVRIYDGSVWVDGSVETSTLATAAQGALADTAVQPNDSPSFGSITVTGTVDGRDIAADGTKLDGIEASADVTDTANVTSAGALMASEVVNLTQVKAFDSADYATAAQGTLADSAVQLNDSPTFGAVTATSYAGDGSALTGLPAGYTNADVDAHLNYSTATSGQVLSYSGADYDWVDASAGGGLFKGDNGTVGSSAGDIFRINEQTLNTSTTIDADENASATGPLAIATGVTLTVTSGGNLSIV